MAIDATWKLGTLYPYLDIELLENGKPVNVEAALVTGININIKGVAPVAAMKPYAMSYVTDGKDGKVRYKWPTTGSKASETETLGEYEYEVEPKWKDGVATRPAIFPSEETEQHRFRVIAKLV